VTYDYDGAPTIVTFVLGGPLVWQVSQKYAGVPVSNDIASAGLNFIIPRWHST
jgi:hypothetical protein